MIRLKIRPEGCTWQSGLNALRKDGYSARLPRETTQMDERDLIETPALQSAGLAYPLERPRIVAPTYRHVMTRDKQAEHMRAILFSFNDAVLANAKVLTDPAAFLRLATAHGYPASPPAIRLRKYHNVSEIEARTMAQQNCLGSELIEIWENLSPLIAMRAMQSAHGALDATEPFTPGPLRLMHTHVAPLREALGLEIIRNFDILEDPFAFFQLCLELGYEGPGSHHFHDEENDLNRAVGRRLLSVWRLVIAL